jgi:hypothetical protein
MYEPLQRLHDDTRSNKKYDKFDLTPKQFIGHSCNFVGQ